MHRWVAFLRGMNLGRRRITNDELRAAFEGMGLGSPTPFLASGNVVFDTVERARKRLAARIESGLAEALGYEVVFNVLMPESAWGRYFERAARSAGDPESPHHDPEARALVAQEAGAYYGYGGRGTVGYLFAGARQGGV